jgi:hypothetical protein
MRSSAALVWLVALGAAGAGVDFLDKVTSSGSGECDLVGNGRPIVAIDSPNC